MTEKLCVFCQHCEFDNSSGYGDYPDPATLRCNKGHLLREDKFKRNFVYDIDDFREMIITAKDCPDYTLAVETEE